MVSHFRGVKVEIEKWDNGYAAYVSDVDEDVEHHLIYLTQDEFVKGVMRVVKKMIKDSLSEHNESCGEEN